MQNLRKCIKLESDDIKNNTSKTQILHKMMGELVKVLGEKEKNQSKLIWQIKENLRKKLVFDQQYKKSN